MRKQEVILCIRIFLTPMLTTMERSLQTGTSLLPRLFASGVCGIIDVASSMRSTRRTVELSARYGPVYSAIGVHPNEVKDMTDADYDTLRELARLPKVVAIGEIGFDFYWDASGRDTQREHFERRH